MPKWPPGLSIGDAKTYQGFAAGGFKCDLNRKIKAQLYYGRVNWSLYYFGAAWSVVYSKLTLGQFSLMIRFLSLLPF